VNESIYSRKRRFKWSEKTALLEIKTIQQAAAAANDEVARVAHEKHVTAGLRNPRLVISAEFRVKLYSAIGMKKHEFGEIIGQNIKCHAIAI
jgi:hypothetical protein